ncbi:MAG: Lrp/AsnC ligand binding domain-containing protein [Chloroflexi bacterium]|jgi:DNA-binding Lrp family transcriptional regulator|nr:Lrp/AsnC ligand binding domain-containing protein [Chloroflexota bacterium]
MKAYVLISVRTGDLHAVVRHLRSVDGVVEASMTFGPYDAVATVEAESVESIGKILYSQIQPIPGILETLTCLAVNME